MRVQLDVLSKFTHDPAKLRRATDFCANIIHGKLKVVARDLQKEVRLTLNTTQSRFYQVRSRSSTKKTHWVSKPGFPANTDTGNLAKGVELFFNKSKYQSEIKAKPKNSVYNYAEILEDSDRHNRPFFFNTIKRKLSTRELKKLTSQIKFAIKNELQGMLLEQRLK